MLLPLEDGFLRLALPELLKPALGGIVAGVFGLFFLNYGIMGVGYEGINNVFQLASEVPSGQLLLLLLSLGFLKVVATASTVGSEGSGGVFPPTLYIESCSVWLPDYWRRCLYLILLPIPWITDCWAWGLFSPERQARLSHVYS